MKTKTQNLTGAALDWAVAKCEGVEITFSEGLQAAPLGTPSGQWEMYSTNWAQGGPIIERERIHVYPGPQWTAGMKPGQFIYGLTPLIAAMRCFVASKLGDEMEVPDELIKENQS